ncbi:L-aminopeptidase/D-esterase-like protein [Paenarthrobacter nicotinovorans]|uniref:P1 family peptidase n=1 Tax=Paenarthrobacter nicotinovorans TaxID=29320 RepID=UPI002787EA29|nr:P1 family peptidase [Paenarthrobacter nicotinovorans]MDP9935792.1 L-aminopeptidase/D-esterase-like protein [Paenarthrobacter nicotinovorans]
MNSITDVEGIRIGHVQKNDDGWLSGVTVVLPPVGTVGSVDVRGGGPGTHETDALDPTTLVSTVDAVVLTGGSAFGLVSAHGAQRWCEEQGRGFAVPGTVVPIVPAAAIFDLGRGGDVHARPDQEMGYQAAAAAFASGDHAAVERGNVGAGTGAVIARGQYKGGVGTSSIELDGGVVVGAIAIVNALGSPVGLGPGSARLRWGHDGGVPWPSLRGEGAVGEERPSAQRVADPQPKPQGLNTTLVVIATNAVLDVAECKRTASSGHAGLARALDPSHTLADGDTVFALATGAVALDRSSEQARQVSLITLQSAAAEAVRLAILDGVESAESITTAAGSFPAYRPVGE